MTRRLDSAARDYAIALVAIGRINGFHDVLRRIDLRLARDMEDAEDEVCETTWQHDGIRLVRARVALYLRLLRRVEAWERDPWGWAEYQPDGAVVLNGRVIRDEETADILHQYDGGELRGFVPLWTLAPAHRPGVTARMRRGRVEALGREAPGPEVVT